MIRGINAPEQQEDLSEWAYIDPTEATVKLGHPYLLKDSQ
jgi:hypothetical protein